MVCCSDVLSQKQSQMNVLKSGQLDIPPCPPPPPPPKKKKKKKKLLNLQNLLNQWSKSLCCNYKVNINFLPSVLNLYEQ